MATSSDITSTTTTTSIAALPHETNGEWIRLCRHGQWEALRSKIEATLMSKEKSSLLDGETSSSAPALSSSSSLPSQLFRWVIRCRNVPLSFIQYLFHESAHGERLARGHSVSALVGC
jgi:hypothetical protein